MLDAVVLAGGMDKGEIAAQTGVVYRPLLEVAGKPILHHVLVAVMDLPAWIGCRWSRPTRCEKWRMS